MEKQSGNVVFYQPYKYSSLTGLQGVGKMHGARRVVAFCCMTAVLPTILLIIPLYLRHSLYNDVTYAVAESDVVEMGNGLSSVFCQEHSLRMNSTFSAYQLSGTPEISATNRKHLQLKKSLTLPDDTLEYWGFYLPRGSTVNLSVCARYGGAHILLVSGEKVLPNCADINKQGTAEAPHMAQGRGQVVVTFEGAAQEILHSDSTAHQNKMDFAVEGEGKEEQENHGGELNDDPVAEDKSIHSRKQRHQRARMKHYFESNPDYEVNTTDLNMRKRSLENFLNNKDNELVYRRKRKAEAVPKVKLDGGIAHGGNAINFTKKKENDSSISSFELNLLTCHDGRILLHKEFSPSDHCISFKYFADNYSHMQTTHQVVKNGYYYYIFYSDNDFRDNHIYAIFDIYKPTYEFGNYSKACKNVTECTFPVRMFSDDMVVVEVPTRDGIEHESDDITHLISTCHPRSAIYAIFPVTVLFLILGCAFL